MNRLNLIYHPTTHNATLSDTCVDSSFTDEGNASGFFNSKAQRERFAEYHDFSATNATVRDEKTGFGYFGARYMDHELMTMWLSVDPMADKYPSLSPYNYCAGNPVRLIDPDGREVYINGEQAEESVKYLQTAKMQVDRDSETG